MNFFVWLNEQQQGPFDEDAIQKMVSEGQITHETLLCPEGGDLNWTPAKELFPPDLPIASDTATISPSEPLSDQEVSVISSVKNEDDGARLEIRLTSGLELKIKAFRLYDEISLAELNSKRAQALKSFQGVSTGLGSIGSIGWVLATSVVIGAVEGVLSAAASSSGVNLLADVIRMEQKLRLEGVFYPVGKIENIEVPIPGLWRVQSKRMVRLKTGTNFWTSEEVFENREIPSAYIHSGDEFLLATADDGTVCSIRWSSVEHFIHLKSAPSALSVESI